MNRRDRAELMKFLDTRGPDDVFANHVRLALELDRIGSALETIVTLMDDREEETPIEDQASGNEVRWFCESPDCEEYALEGFAHCKAHNRKPEPKH